MAYRYPSLPRPDIQKYLISRRRNGKPYYLKDSKKGRNDWIADPFQALMYPTRGQAEYAAVKRNINGFFVEQIKMPPGSISTKVMP